jgi:hypothetical protein
VPVQVRPAVPEAASGDNRPFWAIFLCKEKKKQEEAAAAARARQQQINTQQQNTRSQPTPRQAAPAPQPSPQGPHFRSCKEARAAGYSHMRRGEPGYSPHLDRDNDGIACDKHK